MYIITSVYLLNGKVIVIGQREQLQSVNIRVKAERTAAVRRQLTLAEPSGLLTSALGFLDSVAAAFS